MERLIWSEALCFVTLCGLSSFYTTLILRFVVSVLRYMILLYSFLHTTSPSKIRFKKYKTLSWV